MENWKEKLNILLTVEKLSQIFYISNHLGQTQTIGHSGRAMDSAFTVKG
jgi:hypothetical protein